MIKTQLLQGTAMSSPGDEFFAHEPKYVPPTDKRPDMKVYKRTKRHIKPTQTLAISKILDEQWIKEDKPDADGRMYGHYREGWSDMRVAETIGGGVTMHNVHHVRSDAYGFIRTNRTAAERRNAALSAGLVKSRKKQQLEFSGLETPEPASNFRQRLDALERAVEVLSRENKGNDAAFDTLHRNVLKLMTELGIEYE